MRIVSVLTSSSRGGAEFAAVNLLDVLAERGHEVVLLTDLEGIARDTRVRTAPVELGPKLARRTWPGLVARSPVLLGRLAAAVRAQAPYDVLLLHFKKEQLLALALPARLAPAIAWCEWGPVPHPLRAGLPGRLYARAARRASVVLAVSEGTRDSVVEAGGPADRVDVVANVVRTTEVDYTAAGRARLRAELAIPESAPVVGCISRFNAKKRNDVLVDAVIALRDDRVHLLLAGEGETEAELRRRAAPLGARAHFLPTPWERTPDVLSASDIVVFCPSPTEGQPLAVVNGLLCRRAVVASAGEGVRGLLPADAVARPEHDPMALAALLRAYLGDPARRIAEGEQGRRRVEELVGADAVGMRAEDALRRAIARASRGGR